MKSSISVVSAGALLGCAAIMARAAAPEPGWWSNIKNSDAVDNAAAINVGQVKHVATQAAAHLNATLGLTASDWDAAYGGAAANPLPFTPGTNPENFAVANVGQLKAVGLGFYVALHEHAPWYDVRARLLGLGVPEASISADGQGAVFPWAATVAEGENHAAANIGQLKIVFSFDLVSMDFDGDGMSNGWEFAYGLNPYNASDATGNPDGDNANNLAEYLAARNPTVADSGTSAPAGYQLVLRVPTSTPNYYKVNTSSFSLSSL